MIRNFFDWLENWVMGDPNSFISLGKFLLIGLIFIGLIAIPISYFLLKVKEP